MKKVFLFLTMLLFAFTGTMKAQSLTVHDGSATNGNVPVYGYYADAYNKCEMVYPSTELGEMAGGMINGMTFYATQTSVSWGANFQVFLAEVENATISAFAGPGTVVYEGQLSISGGEMVVTFNTPYTYGGGNLLVGFYQTSTGSYITSTWNGETVTGASGSGYSYSSLASCSFSQKNFLPKTTFDYVPGGGGGDLTTTPDVLDLGYRPNGAWMAPYVFAINATGLTTINALDFSGNYFTYNAELPATIYAGNPLEVAVTTGEAEEGAVNSTMTVLFSNRDAQQFNVTANAYDPVAGDVFENAIEPTAMPYAGNAPAGIYKNYDLPTATEGADAMYKVTFDNDVLFSAGTAGENAVTAIYPEDFNGEDGPMADNNYVYNGPTINPGPLSMWFGYEYTGTNTWYGTSAGGGTMWGYKITPAMLQELGLGNCAITTVETAARNSAAATYYDLVILKGGDEPDLNNIVYYQSFEDFTPGYFFDVNLDEPQFLGDDENIWVMFYSDSPYAAYCGRYPVDTNNGKIWYTTNLTNWYSSTTYTPVIYTRFLELPTGREVTVNLADMKIRESQPAAGQIAEANGDVMGVAKAQIAKANRGNRDQQTLIEQGFEDGMGDWTMYHCSSSSGITIQNPNTGSYCFDFYYTADYPQYLISPELDDNNGGTMTFYAKEYSTSYPESYKLGYSTTTNDVSAFTFGAEITDLTLLYAEKTFDFPAGTKYVCIACTSNDMFHMYVDDITITADITTGGGTPEPPTATYQIEDLYVPAGTYYVAVASTTDNFNVDMAVEEVPAPEQAIVYAPYDGETNVEAPYLAEWVLGDYTTEMQVLVGTQYPPQTALIDWTDYLVESAFITDLEPNQSYFMQVNERNAAGTTYGEIIAFTTPVDPVEGFAVADEELYPGDAAVFTWTANARTLKGYNLYQDGVKINEAPINATEYAVEGLEYNMDGYDFQVSAVYDAGESELSDVITVYMTGFGSVAGIVYDTDTLNPIAGVSVLLDGVDQFANPQDFYLETAEDGTFTGEILAGIYTAYVATESYDPTTGTPVTVYYDDMTDGIVIITHEFYYPLGQITATEEDDDVLVEWSWDPAEMIVDFETGDFSQAEFTLPTQYAWTVTTTNPYEGTYCMKSTCEGQASASSIIEATIEVPFDEAKMGFWVRTSSEANYDKFHFYIDGVEKGQALSGQNPYAYKEYSVEAGVHTYKWEYTKDSSVNSNDDCIYVDNITMYRKDEPIPPTPGTTTYTFDNSTMEGWTTIDANNDGYDWVLGSEIGGVYLASGASLAGSGHDESADLVCSGSYSNATSAAITPDNYLVAPAQINAQAGASISFYACAQDASYAAEHFGVAVSTTTATASAFTMVQEWTMTAKNSDGAETNAAVRGTRAQGSWYNYNVDLSSYAGQTIWVAIRHFNCNDQFILNVDDITIYDGSTKMAPRNNREFMSFNLYRRNNIVNEEPELIAEGINGDVFEYTDAEWAELPYGKYQWGIAATYDGYAPTERSRETATFGFENGSLEGWTNLVVNTDGGEWLHSNNNLGGYDYTTLAHTGTGFAMCYSYVDYDGPYDTDAYLVSPQKYSVDANSSIAFWADNANDNYPENFSICVSTAETPTAASFTQVWSGGAKGTGNGGATVRRSDNRYENWRSHEVSLSAYAGQEVWIAFHDVNYDMYEIWIDDVTITYAGTPTPPTPPAPTGSGISEILWSNVIEKDMEATLTFDINLNNGQSAEGAAITVVGANNEYEAVADEEGFAEIVVRKGDTYDIAVAMDGYTTWNPAGNPIIVEDDIDYEILLNEVIINVENFYVSPTGMAVMNMPVQGDRSPISYKMELDGEYIGESYAPYYQFDVEGMEEGETHVGGVAPLYASGMGDWSYYTWTYKACSHFNEVTEFTSAVNEQTVTLNWTLPGGQPTPPTPGEGQWYQYGTDVVATGVGASGAFYWAVMFPAGSYEGEFVTKAATYEMSGYPFSGTVTIYNDGTNAPATAVGTMPVSVAGATDQWAEFEFAEPIAIDPTKNLWIVFYNETSTSYPAAACADAGDPNARWVSLDGSSWMDLATAGLSGYSWMIKAYVAQGAKGEVNEISVPTMACNNAGVLSSHPVRNNRDMWDLVYEFNGTSGYQYGVASDGEYIYTSSWSASSTSMFYKYDLEGNFIEEFNISGCGQLRGMTYDGQYFYGVANSSTIYCVDLANHTLVSSTSSAYGAMRAITYDPERDGFWVVGNWSGNLTLVSRTGSIVTVGATPTSASDCAYYKDPQGVEHVYCFNNGTNDVDDYNIATNTITSAVFNFNTNPAVTGSSGGCFVGAYNGKTCFFGDIQQSPQHIAIYELDAEGPVPPTPVEGILGAILYRDGEVVDFFDYNTTTFSEVLEPGDYTYTVRVVYAGEIDVTYFATSCGENEAVTIEPLSTPENEVVSSIYPNPTSGDLHITATAMQHVTVFNTMGQVVFSTDVDTDEFVLNMGQFEVGVFMIKVDTAEGSSVKRITVVK